MSYVDGFVLAVRTADKEKFRDFAQRTAEMFVEYGALRVRECWGVDTPDGVTTSFPMAVKKAADETVVLSRVEWESKAKRDAVMEKMMEDPRFDPETNPVPFDGQRMIFGGFEPIVDV